MSTEVLLKLGVKSRDSRHSFANLAPSISEAPSVLCLPPKVANAENTSRSCSFAFLGSSGSEGAAEPAFVGVCTARKKSFRSFPCVVCLGA